MRPPRATPLAPALCILVAGHGAALDGEAGDVPIHVVAGAEDTLWSIAAAMPRGDATVAQAMEAIRLANPDAFVEGDIDRLRAGTRLRLPRLAQTPSRNGGTGESARGAAHAPPPAEPAADPAPEASATGPRSPQPARADDDAAADAAAERNRFAAERARLTENLARSRQEVSELQEQLAAARRTGAERPPAGREQPSIAPRLLLGAALFLVGLVAGVVGAVAWRRGTEAGAPAPGGAGDGAPGDALEEAAAPPGEPAGTAAAAADAPGADRMADLAQRMQAQPGAVRPGAGRSSGAAAGADVDFDAAAGGFEGDAAAVKLKLARSLVDIGDAENARELLDEIGAQGNASQRAEALALLARL